MTEGDADTTAAVVPLALSAPSGRTVEVSVATADGSAKAGSDYQAVATKVSFAPGQTAASVSVPIVGDTVAEPTRTFSVTASSDTASVAAGGGSVTVLDEDGPPVVTAVAAPASAKVGTPVAVRVDFTDQDRPDRHSATVTWGDGSTSPATVQEQSGSGSASATHTYATAGLFTPTVTVTDTGGGRTARALPFVAVWDTAGKVNADGRIGDSKGPKFTVSATYPKKAPVPDGSVTFQSASIDFSSTGLDWLVVSGDRAVIAGTGKVKSQAGYRFFASLVGGPDPRIRMQVLDPAGAVVLDNEPGTPLDARPVRVVAKAKVAVG